MISIIGKYKTDIALWLILTIIFFGSRLTNLTILPVFVDEAIYIRWSQVMRDPNWRFIPLTDGKQPLFMWIAAFPVAFLADPLLAARLVSVVAGFAGVIGLWLVGRELFGKSVGWLAAFLYTIIPFFFFYDRLAVVDGLLTVLGIWSLYLSIVLVKQVRLDVAMLLGMVIGAATLTKSPGFFYLLCAPATLALFNFRGNFWPRLIKLVGLFVISTVIVQLIYNLLRLSPYFYLIAQRTWDFILRPQEVWQNGPFWWLLCRGATFNWGCGRIFEVIDWLAAYFTWPLFALAIVGFFIIFKKNWRIGLVLAIWSFGPLLVETVIAKGFTARYILFATFPFIISLALVLSNLPRVMRKMPRLAYLLIFAMIVPSLVFDYWLMANPAKAAIPQKEREGYLEQWSAGYGIVEIANFLKQKAKGDKQVLVGTEGIFGTLPDGLQIYTRDTANLTVVGMGQTAEIFSVPQDLKEAADRGQLAYLVVNSARLHAADDSYLRLIARFPRPTGPTGQEQLLFFQIVTPGLP